MKSIQLRAVLETDLPSFFEHQKDSEASLMAAFPSRSKEVFMKHWAEKVLGNPTATNKTILKDEQIVGYISCWQQEGKHLIGYWIDRKHWGKGFATEALSEFLGLIKHRPLNAYVAKHNVGSVRVLEKCGFKTSGQSTHFSELHGHAIDELFMTLA